MKTETIDPDRAILREKQIKQAEELLASIPERLGVAKGMFWGKFVADWVFPYPQLAASQRGEVEATVAEVSRFCVEELDPERIDKEKDIPQEVFGRLRELGVLGMTAPKDAGGRAFSQMAYGRILEVIGGRCASTGLFVNAHHSIGMRALLLFGTDDQKSRWLPNLVSGKKLAAFALTEVEAGSDAGNVQTTATLSEDGTHYVLRGKKRYITNGGIADVLTVMARTPKPEGDGTEVTAFLVTPDMPGFQVVEPRMEKLGVRGTATAKLAFENMRVPVENVLGPLGKGLKVALTVLDFGRATFGACCTGSAKSCLQLAVDYARQRRQFGQTLAEFELVQQKIARMAGWTYAMEAMTTVTGGLIDRGLEDYMLETAMLKVWSTERLWTIVNDAFQIHGGAAYFTDRPLERMLRDYRINQIGEGANEVLVSFIALTGMRGPGLRLQKVREAVQRPWNGLGMLARFAADWSRSQWGSPAVPVRSPELHAAGRRLGRMIKRFGHAVQNTLIRHREQVLDRQLEQERLTWAAMEMFAASCVLSRADHEIASSGRKLSAVARWSVEDSLNRASRRLDSLNSRSDSDLLDAAAEVLAAGEA